MIKRTLFGTLWKLVISAVQIDICKTESIIEIYFHTATDNSHKIKYWPWCFKIQDQDCSNKYQNENFYPALFECFILLFLFWSNSQIMTDAGVYSSGWVLHVYSADADSCAGLGLSPQPDDGVHTSL